MNRTLRNTLLAAVAAVLCLPASAQDDLRARFDAFRKQATQRYESFRDSANAVYLQFMREAWESYGVEPPKEAPKREPLVPPVVKPQKESEPDPPQPVIRHRIEFQEVITPRPMPLKPMPVSPVRPADPPEEEWLSLTFYNTPCRVRFDMDERVYLKNTDENGVADMWSQLLSEPFDLLLHDCLALRESMALCDWAYVKFTEAVAKSVYGERHADESNLLQAYLLNQSGFQLRLARTSEGRIYPLLASACDLYGYPYWTVAGEHYYMLALGSGQASQISIYAREFPKEHPMRMDIDTEQRFAADLSPMRQLQSRRYREAQVEVAVNKNLLEFFNDYPASYANNDPLTRWLFYGRTPLSEAARETLYPVLREQIAGRSQSAAANILLNFVQTAFEYAYDDEVWGHDRAFFADETLYYPYCDCEDRAILFARLVHDLMGLEVAYVYYPGHLAAAVHFTEEVAGDYFEVKGKSYVVCDPTYINAYVGETMPGMNNSAARLVFL